VVTPVDFFSAERMPVVFDFFIWIIVSDFPAWEHFVKESVQGFVEPAQDESKECREQNRPCRALPTFFGYWMLSSK
jgi:hypothetical protein